jgi:hypothetical protein
MSSGTQQIRYFGVASVFIAVVIVAGFPAYFEKITGWAH